MATIMVSEVYDALIEAGASDEKARRAAAAVAGYENRFAATETRLSVLTWMVGFNLLLTAAVLGKLLA